MAIATGIETVVSIKKQSAKGTPATGGSGQQLRRTGFPLDLKKATYESAEIVTHGQVADMRHGVRRVEGKYSDELSPLTHKLMIQSAMRRDFTTGATTGALTTIAATAGPPGTFTDSANGFITAGFKVGDIVRASGFLVATANNSRNYRITALTAGVMTVGTTTTGASGQAEAVIARVAGDTVTIAVVGKKTYIPVSGRTSDWWTIEKWFADITQSELYTDCRMGTLGFRLPSTGMAGIDIDILGRNLTRGTSQALTSPSAVTTSTITAAVNGNLRVGSVDIGTLTGLNFSMNPSLTPSEAAVGSNVLPDIFYGRARITGQFSVYFEDAVMRDAFVDETEIAVQCMLTTNNTVTAEFMNFVMSRVKVGDAAKSDAEFGIIQTFPFVALLDQVGSSTTNTENTSLSIQDSQA